VQITSLPSEKRGKKEIDEKKEGPKGKKKKKKGREEGKRKKGVFSSDE